jgi:hypothetical protein
LDEAKTVVVAKSRSSTIEVLRTPPRLPAEAGVRARRRSLPLCAHDASAGTYDLRSHRSWDGSVPGTFYILSMVFCF